MTDQRDDGQTVSTNRPARLRVQDLAIGYEHVLHEPLSFDVPPGQILAIVGPSGCGKSTLLATIAGLLPPHGGRVLIDGVDVTTWAVHRRHCPMVFQDPMLFAHLDVVGNVAYGLRRQGLPRGVARTRALELLDWAGLRSTESQRVENLSGGQAQRVSLIRAIAANPSVLLLDEPFSALDAPLRRRLADDIRQMVTDRGISAVHVTHDAEEAERMASSIIDLG